MTETGIKMVAGFEGLPKGDPLAAYWDKNGKVWTIGYGATHYLDNRPVKQGDKLNSKEEALDLLRNMLVSYENKARQLVTPNIWDNQLTPNQQDSLTSFTYNVGSGNFGSSTLLKYVKANPNDERIKGEFAKWRKSGGEVLEGLVKRRAKEAAHYFNTEVEDLSGYIESNTKGSFNGSGNMFDELSHSADWTVTEFKLAPAKINNWKNLNKGASCPKVGDLLFGCHDYHEGDVKTVHDHVAIYLGTHNGNVYVAEGASVRGTNINETNKKVQAAKIENSRFGLNTDVITHFAHCNKVNIEQVHFDVANKNGGQTYTDFSYAPAVGEENMKHFKLSETGSNGILHSNFASKKGISNAITGTTTKKGTVVTAQEVRQNLVNLVNYLLDPLYDEANKRGFGRIYSSQTYRSPALVEAMRTPDPDTGKAPYPGAVQYSQHTLGQAIDLCIYPSEKGKTNASELMKVGKLLYDWSREDGSGIEFDQLIYEGIGSTTNPKPGWLHISFKKGGNRKWKDDENSNYKLAYSITGVKVVPLSESLFNSWYA